MTRDEWLLARRQGVSASDVAGIMGLSPWSTPFSVYADKVGLVPDKTASEQMEFGKDIEQIVAKKWSKRSGLPHVWMDELVVGPEAWILATPDAGVPPDGGLEVKTMGYKNDEWGDENTDHVPDRVLCQCQWQMLTCGWQKVHVCAFYTGPRKFESFLVYADKQLQDSLVKRCRQFWVENVLAQKAPELDWSESADTYLKQRFPTVMEEPREATAEEGDLAVAYSIWSKKYKDAEKRKKALSNQLKGLIGNAKAIVGTGFKVSWYDVAGSTFQVTRKPGRTLKASGEIFRGQEDG